MKLKLIREVFTPTETLGLLLIDGAFFCYTLEDFDRGLDKSMDLKTVQSIKVHSNTAIPYGTYKVSLSVSNRFKRLMPEIQSVPGFAGVRIHGGNTHLNTEGCILVAKNRSIDKVSPFGKIRNWIQGTMENELTKKLKGQIVELEITKK
jgi:hypothetical protein